MNDGIARLLAVGYLLAGSVGVLAARLFQSGEYAQVIGCLAAMTLILTAYEWRRLGHPLSPAGIVALSGLVLFVLRPLTIAQNGITTAGAAADARYFEGPTVAAANVALYQIALFYFVFGVAYFYRTSRATSLPQADESSVDQRAVRRAGAILLVALLLAVACAALLIQGSGGLAQHFSGLSVRSSFLAGRYYLTLGYIPLAIALGLYVLLRRRSGAGRVWDGLAALSALGLLFSAFVTGARGPLVLGAIVPLLLLKQAGPKKFSPRALALIGLGLTGGALLVGLVFRQNTYDGGATAAALRSNPLQTLLDRLTSGAETIPFDSLILLNEAAGRGALTYQLGSTYATVPTWFIPGNLLPGKLGGANAWFTSTFMPRFYYPDRIETSISAIGEGFANFGYVGIAIIAALVALAASKVGLARQPQSVLRDLFAITLTPMFFSFLRGDSYQNISTIILMGAFAALAYSVSARPLRQPAADQRAHPVPERTGTLSSDSDSSRFS